MTRLLGASLLAALWFATPVHAQERDPTRAPAEATLPASKVASTVDTLPPGIEGMPVLVRDGQAHLVVGTRLVAVGQTLGGYTLERISDAEVWLRKGKALHKVARFAGIQRRAASSVSPAQP